MFRAELQTLLSTICLRSSTSGIIVSGRYGTAITTASDTRPTPERQLGHFLRHVVNVAGETLMAWSPDPWPVMVVQRKTQRPVQFEVTEPTRAAAAAWIDKA